MKRGSTTLYIRAILQKRDKSRATSNKMMYKTTDSQHLKLKQGRYVSVSLKLLHNSNLLQISISASGMPVIEASLTLPFLYQYQCQWQQVGNYRPVFRLPFNFCFYCRFDLLHRRKCTYSYTCVCFQKSRAFLVRNLSVWKTCLC